MLITNDYQATQIPVAVEGQVLSGITVSPLRYSWAWCSRAKK